ncbi:MAG TPA: DUF1614 domain-containing protein, partial [Steroidobacteraceae bacterium]
MTAPALLGLAMLFVIVAAFVAARVLSFASASMGLAPTTMMGVLLASLLGSYINIPIAYLPEQHMLAREVVTYFGIPYAVPVMRSAPATVLAINVGGALIPICMSLYLMVHNQLYTLSLWGIAVVALACHLLAAPVPGLGIAEPILVPCVVTTVMALTLSRRHAGALAYICGS